MGIIRDFFNRIIKRRGTKLLETATQEEIKDFIDAINSSGNEKTKALLEQNLSGEKIAQENLKRNVEIVNNFITLINDGKVDIGGISTENPYKRILNYFSNNKEIKNTILEIINRKFYDEIEKSSNGETYEQVHNALDRTLDTYLKTIGSDKDINKLYEIGKVKLLQGIIKKNILLVENSIEISNLSNKVSDIYEGNLLFNIKKEKDVDKQIAMYDEYIRDFRNGKEIDIEKERDYLSYPVIDVYKMDFMKDRELRKLCKNYSIPSTAKISKIYITETFKQTKERNNALCKNNIKVGEVKTSDLVLVKATTMFPNNRILESVDKYSDLLEEQSPFEKQLRKVGVIDLSKYKMLKFQNRRTVHFTLNGLSAKSEQRDSKNENYIIIEPFEEHINDDNLININEADTYFEGDLVLSKKATILVPVEKYKRLIKDEKILKELNKFDTRLFDGNEEEAVRMCLLDKGYTFGYIKNYGFNIFTSREANENYDPCEENEKLIFECETKLVRQLQQQGKNVKHGVYFCSESKVKDMNRTIELRKQEYQKLVECINATCDFEFSKTILMNDFLSSAMMPQRVNYGDFTKPHLNIEKIFEKLKPEGVERALQKYNTEIIEEHNKAREAKDEKLKESGLIVEESKLNADFIRY